jgi:hypothetical protein
MLIAIDNEARVRCAHAVLAWLLVLSVVGCGSSDEAGVLEPDGAPADASPGDAAHADAGPWLPGDSGAKADAMFDGAGLDAADAGCTRDDACPPGALCASGTCVPGCTAAHGCVASSVCCAGQCHDLSSDPDDCAACGRACSSNNVPAPTCVGGVCAGSCAFGFADCDHNLLKNGCETNVASDSTNCGACGVVCSSENVAPACSMGVCDGACAAGFADCNGDKQTDGCETNTQGDTANCGACGVACSTAHVTSVACSAGLCKGACVAGWMDCDNDIQLDGCETDVASDPVNCGACGAPCSGNHVPAPACSGGQCDGACAAGWADCNGNLALDGCEQNIQTSAANCGACGAACTKTCAAGSCVCRLGLPDAPLLLTQSAPAAIAAADFDRDGRADLAEVSMTPVPGGGYAVRVFLNQGGALFTSKDYATHAGGMALVAADINGDGYPDLATAEFDAQSVDILYNDRHGGFGPATQHVVADQPVDLALVNGALVIVDQYSNSLTSIGGGAGTPTGKLPVAIAAGDVDGDGVQDMAVANLDDSTVSVYASHSGGARTDYPTGTAPVSVAIADLNGDKAPELLVGEGGTASLRVFVNPGNGMFGASTTYPTVGSGGRPKRIAVADFNEDGHPDVVTANDFAGSSLTVFLNQGNGTLGIGAAHTASNAPDDGSGLAIGDFQGRGHADIAIAEGTVSAAYLFLGDGKGQVIRPPTVSTGAGSVGVAVGDVNGDGALDLVGANYDGKSISIILSAGGRTFLPRTDYDLSAQPNAVALADFNGDGLLDVVTANTLPPGDICVLLNTKGKGGAFGAPVHYAASTSISADLGGVATGDIDGDGDMDIVAADYEGIVALFFNDGQGAFAKVVSVSAGTGSEPGGVALVDLNGDHLLDLVVSGSELRGLLNTGGGTFGAPTVYPASSNYIQGMGTGDLDGDGRVDLVGVGGSSGGFVEVLLNGASGFSAATSYRITDSPGSILVSDIDGDGRPDVVAASQNDNSGVVSVLLNTGGGVLAPRLDFSTPLGTKGIAARDLDGDGHTDVVATVDYNGGSGMYLLYGGCL